MMASRAVFRWALVAVAGLLALVAVLLLLIRLLFSQSALWTSDVEALLEARIGVPVTIERLSVSLERNDIFLRLEGVEAATPDGEPLLSLDSAQLRLDSLASLANRAPIFSNARIDGFSFHLYQSDNAGWGWPAPAALPLLMNAETAVDLGRIDKWAGVILRQQLLVEDTRVTLHGEAGDVALYAPTLLLSGDQRRTRLQGEINIVDSDTQPEAQALPAVDMVAEMQPGEHGFSDFSAALQVDMQLDHLIVLADVLRPDRMPHLEQAGGAVTLWGRWHAAQLDEARLAVNIPQLTLRHEVQYAVLRDIQANGIWQRDGKGGNAWLSANAESVEWAQPEGVSEGPALPRHWYVEHQPGRWQLRTSAFELASLTAWRDYVLLPESLTRVMQTLSPRGQVQGISIGQREGHWGVDAALTNVAVSPWDEAPGGGPLDAWVQARDLRGRVRFNSAGDTSLDFPELYNAPMTLSHAEGVVEWVYDGPRTMISGRDLNASWDGARLSGGFGLVTGQEGGQFGLDIDFADVDALNSPLSQWLPIKAFDPELRDWLLTDIGGYVPHGSLKLSFPLGQEELSEDQLSATLALEVERAHLPIALDWPLLEDVQGQLVWQDKVLRASVDHASALGIETRNADVKMEDEQLRVSGPLSGSGEALKRFLQAMPEMSFEQLDDVQVAGHVAGELALAVPLSDPDALTLEINAEPTFSSLSYRPLPIAMTEVGGALTWLQEGDDIGLSGHLSGRLPGGHVAAQIDTQAGGISLEGAIETSSLFRAIDIPERQARQLLEGRAQWRGQVQLEPELSARVSSRLLGVTSHLPAPFVKSADTPWPLSIRADMGNGQVHASLANILDARLLTGTGLLAANIALGSQASPHWPRQEGVHIDAALPELDPMAWQAALAPLLSARGDGEALAGSTSMPPISMALTTPCIAYRGECVSALDVTGRYADQTLTAEVDSDLVAGRVAYRPDSDRPLDIALGRLNVDRLMAIPDGADEPASLPQSWMDAVETDRASPAAIPDWLATLPNGRLRLAEITAGGTRAGPLTAYWQSSGRRFSLMPVGLTLGQLSARGELVWEGTRESSQTHANMTLQGGDVGTALEHLDQPVALRSESTDVSANLRWPGAPWQWDLTRATGGIEVDVRDGRFVTLESTPARLIGLLNFDNILRRLRLDFSDLTGEGTAFNRVHGAADVGDGQLILRGPLQIDAPATTLALTGSVDLLNRTMDQRLSVALPVSQSLPIAAIAVGAPVVGGALFIADQLFGDALNRATTLYYRVRGPWTSPQVNLEGPQ